MQVEVTQLDMFLDYLLTRRGVNLTLSEMVADTRQIEGFWSEDQKERFLVEAMEDRLRKMLKKVPRYDEKGQLIERVAVKRNQGTDKQGNDKQLDLWIEIPDLTYEDKVQVIDKHLERWDYFQAEATRLCKLFLENSPAKDRRRLQRRYQGLLDLGDAPPDANEN